MIGLKIKSNWFISKTMDKVDKVNKSREVKAAKLVAKEARRIVVVRSGELKGSIKQKGSIVTASADHAKFVELGTYKMRAQPFLRPALINMGRKILVIFKGGFE